MPELLTGLPDFLQRNKTTLRFKYQGWDKPVIHFYGAEGMKVSVKVGTPSGIPLAYYPPPEVGKGVSYGSAIVLTNRYFKAVGPVVILFKDGSGLRGA